MMKKKSYYICKMECNALMFPMMWETAWCVGLGR